MNKITWRSRLFFFVLWAIMGSIMAQEGHTWITLLDGFIAGTYFEELIRSLEGK